MRAELSSFQSISAGVEQGRARPAILPGLVDAEARDDHGRRTIRLRDEYRDQFGRCDVGVEGEVQPGAAVENTRYLRPFTDRAEAVAHDGLDLAQSSWVQAC